MCYCVYKWEAILKLYNLLLPQVEFLFIGLFVFCFSQPAKCGDEARATFRQKKPYFSILDSSLWVSFLQSFCPLPVSVQTGGFWGSHAVLEGGKASSFALFMFCNYIFFWLSAWFLIHCFQSVKLKKRFSSSVTLNKIVTDYLSCCVL